MCNKSKFNIGDTIVLREESVNDFNILKIKNKNSKEYFFEKFDKSFRGLISHVDDKYKKVNNIDEKRIKKLKELDNGKINQSKYFQEIFND